MVKNAKNRTRKRAAKLVELPQADDRFTIAIVGGGASGIAAACVLGRALREADVLVGEGGVRIVLLEQGRRMGSSILRSGNGRCNFSHANMDAASYNQPAFVNECFEALEGVCSHAGKIVDDAIAQFVPSVSPNAVLRWFTELGLVWTEAPGSDGLLYPASNKAESVLEVLEAELERCGVECYCGVEVCDLRRSADEDSVFMLDLSLARPEESPDSAQTSMLRADFVVYAAGGDASLVKKSEAFAQIATVPAAPVLGPLRTETKAIEGLDGVRAKVRLSCSARGFSEEGEVLFREYGISGIVVFNASRFVCSSDTVELDFVPAWSADQVRSNLLERCEQFTVRSGNIPTYAEILQGFFLPELAQAIIHAAGLQPEDAAAQSGIVRLSETIKSFSLRVIGVGEARQCQVMRGGIRVDAVDPSSMECAEVPGLFITGEALDVDGPCGGYNLHWAWSSGLLAGASIAQRACARLNAKGDHA